VTRRFCRCGTACWSQAAAFLHFDAHRPGCREISPSEWRERYDTDTRRAS